MDYDWSVGLMAGTAACCTQRIRCCPLFPLHSHSQRSCRPQLKGRWRRRHLSPEHKAGLLTVLFTCTGCVFGSQLELSRVRHFQRRPSQELAGTTPRTGQAPACFNLDLGGGASEVSSTTSMVACRRFLVSTFSFAFLPSVSVFYGPCTYCSRVFVVALSLTSTHRDAHFIRSTTRLPVCRQRSEQSSGSGSDCSKSRTVKGCLRPTYSSSDQKLHTGTLAASVVSPTLGHQVAKLLGTPSAANKGFTRGDRTPMTAAGKEVVSFVSPGFGADHDGPTPSAEDSHVQVPVAASRSRQFQMLVCPR